MSQLSICHSNSSQLIGIKPSECCWFHSTHIRLVSTLSNDIWIRLAQLPHSSQQAMVLGVYRCIWFYTSCDIHNIFEFLITFTTYYAICMCGSYSIDIKFSRCTIRVTIFHVTVIKAVMICTRVYQPYLIQRSATLHCLRWPRVRLRVEVGRLCTMRLSRTHSHAS